MADLQLMRELRQESNRKIVLLVLDGLGGLPVESGGPTELEAARSPNLDRLASEAHLAGQFLFDVESLPVQALPIWRFSAMIRSSSMSVGEYWKPLVSGSLSLKEMLPAEGTSAPWIQRVG